eukprot:m.10470 g.10470  ORF g.10470 m.10470 type:complete len:254 (-) comp5571_c0_seq1:184-945(-)
MKHVPIVELLVLSALPAILAAKCNINNDFACHAIDYTKVDRVNDAQMWTDCAAACFSQGYAGTSAMNGTWCYCSNTQGEFGELLDTSECNITCAGNKAQQCGGPSTGAGLVTVNEFSFNCSAETQFYSCSGTKCIQDAQGIFTDPHCEGKCAATTVATTATITATFTTATTTTAVPPTKHLSIGGYMVVIFICAIVMPYFLIGCAYNAYQGESGSQLLPNAEFWTGLASLIADGFRFTVSGFRSGSVGGYSSL